jgi:5'-deoxynucleotidase YfbR-like HD superfamily hydrolase
MDRAKESIVKAKTLEILSLRASGHTKRWHTLQIIGEQTVAEHSAQAVSLLFMLYPGDPSTNLTKALLWHDSSERYVGDSPAPARRDNPEFSRSYEAVEHIFMLAAHPFAFHALSLLTDTERAWLKAIDVLELLLFCGDQSLLGNTHLNVVAGRALNYLRTDTNTPKEVLEFVDEYQDHGPRSFA